MSEVLSFAHVDFPAREPVHYTACGLDNVYLASGYQEIVIGGQRGVSVRDVDDLHKCIAGALIRKKLLTGREIRFLRKLLDLTQRELGDFLRVSDQSIARYEKDQTPLDGPADDMLRLLVRAHVSGCLNVREELEAFRQSDDAPDGRITIRREHDEWRVLEVANAA